MRQKDATRGHRGRVCPVYPHIQARQQKSGGRRGGFCENVATICLYAGCTAEKGTDANFWGLKMLRIRKTMACVVPTCYMTRGKKVRGEPPVSGYCMKPNAWIMYMIAMSGSGKTRKEISAGYKESQTSWLQQNPGLSRLQQKERMNTEMCAAIAEWSRREPRIRERANVNDGDRKERRRNARERVAKEKKRVSEDSRKKRAGAEAAKRRREKEKADKAAAKKQKELKRVERAARERRREKDKADRAAERKQKELERAERVAKDKRKEMENKAAKVKQKNLAVRIAKKKQKALKDKALANKVSEERKKRLADADKATKKKQKELEDAKRAAKKTQKELEGADKATKKRQKELDDADRAANKRQKELKDSNNAAKIIQKALRKRAAKKSQKQVSSVFFAERDVPRGWSTEKAVADITYGFHQMSRDDGKKSVLVKWTSDGGLREEDVESLLPGEWYFDRAIDKYMDLLQTLSGRTHKCVFLETVFYQNLMAKMGGRKRSWKERHATQGAFFTLDLDTTHRHAKIFIPVIINRNHFMLIFVDNQKHMVYSLDSAGCLRKPQRQNILNWVEQEHSAKNATFKKEEWKTEAMECPEQENNFDCGPFTCLFMAFLSHGKRLHFTQDDLPKMRERINWSLLNSRLETRAEIRESLQKRRKGRSSLLNSASDARAAQVRQKRRKARLAALLKERKQAHQKRRLIRREK